MGLGVKDELLCLKVCFLAFRKNANAAMLSNYEVKCSVYFDSKCFFTLSSKEMKEMCDTSYSFHSASQVFKLLTDLKDQRKDSGKNKHSAGQQNLNTIMYEVGTYPLPLLTVIFVLLQSVPTVSFVFSHRRWSTCQTRPAADRIQRLSKSFSPPWCLTNLQSQYSLTNT